MSEETYIILVYLACVFGWMFCGALLCWEFRRIFMREGGSWELDPGDMPPRIVLFLLHLVGGPLMVIWLGISMAVDTQDVWAALGYKRFLCWDCEAHFWTKDRPPVDRRIVRWFYHPNCKYTEGFNQNQLLDWSTLKGDIR